MARLAKDSILQGLRGSLGNELIFRRMNNKTIVSQKPTHQKKGTAAQQENRGKFREATAYAKAQMKMPERKTYYQKIAKKLKLPNAYTAAITDFMRRPVVGDMECKKQKVVRIKVKASKNGFELKEVQAIVRDSANNVKTFRMRRSGGTSWQTDVEEMAEIKSIQIVAVDFFENYGRRYF